MYNFKVDPHTHTIISEHAYGTVDESLRVGKEKGLEGIAITDHFNDYLGGGFKPLLLKLRNTGILPMYAHGLRLFTGIEIDIVDFKGNLAGHDTMLRDILPFFKPGGTVKDAILDGRDLIIGSVHFFNGYNEGTVAENTNLYVKACENKEVDILGHIGRTGLNFEIEPVVKAAKDNNVLIEINNLSLGENPRDSSFLRCKEIALECAKIGANITTGSDAHTCYEVGEFENAKKLLEEINFPEKYIANISLEKFAKTLNLKL